MTSTIYFTVQPVQGLKDRAWHMGCPTKLVINLRGGIMKPNRLLISASILAAAWMTSGIAFSQSSGSTKSETIRPDGDSRLERTGKLVVPLPKGSSSSGTVEKDKTSSTSSAASLSSRTKDQSIIQHPVNLSQGSTESAVPLPPSGLSVR